jgi:hypothetical protein
MRYCRHPAVRSKPLSDKVPHPFSVSCSSTPSIRPSRRRLGASGRRDGFALLITITLLAFLVLLLVSLASLTRVETQVASNSAQLTKARANALFALNLAVGQLQKYAGPDQRVTARADINSVNTGNPVWTGVWDATPPVPATPTHAAAPASNAPMAWLVSGNEASGTTPTPVTAAVADPAAGNDDVWLVRKVLGQDLAAQLPDYPQDGRVKLAKIAIKVPPSQVPGAAATGADVQVGSYAWWVGDEGIKAKVNLADPYRSAAVSDPEALWRRSAAPRPGMELLDATKASELETSFTATTDAFETKRAGLLSYQQIPMLSTNLSAPTGIAQTGRYFNDLTTYGYGVLADTMRGGLRRDLTRGLAATPASGSVAAGEVGDATRVFAAPMPGPYGRVPIGPTSAIWTPSVEPGAPVWSQVRSWFASRAPADGTAMAPVSAPLTTGGSGTLPTTSGHALVPLPVTVQIGYGFDIGPDLKLRLTLLPRVVLLNPYNVPLAEEEYTVSYIPSVANATDWRVLGGMDYVPADPAKKVSAVIGIREYLPLLQLAFNIRASFEPGQVRVFSLGTDNTFTTGVLRLEPGLFSNYAYAINVDPTKAITAPWFAEPEKIRARIESMPRDHPQITIAVGTSIANSAGTLTAPERSLHARYIQTEAAYVNPQIPSERPNALMGSGGAKMLRMLRFALRDGSHDRIGNGNNKGDTETFVGAVTPIDNTSGVRMLIDNNPRAIVSQMVGGWRQVAQYVATVANYTEPEAELSVDGENCFWGGSIEDDGYGATHVILFDVLRTNEEVVSLGRLGQVNWGVDGKQPDYPLGNSFASIFYNHNEPDYGYALNEALWDRFFMSTLPVSLTTRPVTLPDSRLRFHDPAGASTSLATLEGVNGYQLAATRLMIDGAFNINSTSVEAWAAFLGSVQAADYTYKKQDGANQTDTAVRGFPRVQNLHDPDPTASGQSGKMYEWTGYRQLDATQLRALATQIVAGIKARARPARSLAEFMNRDLSQAATDERNQEGIMQAAINTVVNTDNPDAAGNGRGLSNLSGLNTAKVVAAAFITGDNPNAARGKLRSTGAPGFLMQSDLLAPLAPAMAARSDTFRVRTYGEVVNPVTGDINGRAWCEAVVQRMPEFVGGEAAELRLDDPALGSSSKAFGRKFVIVQFRWLGPDEI